MKLDRFALLVSLVVSSFATAATARADYVLWTVYGVLIEGEVKIQPGGMVTVRSKFGSCHLKLNETKRWELPTPESQYRKQFQRAKRDGAEGYFRAGQWALQHGMLKEFYQALELAAQTDPNHALTKKLLARRTEIPTAASESSEELEKLKKILKQEMKIKRSAHFLLIYDTPDDRADHRLALLERVYESFLMFFWSQGIELPKPAERMRVVLFEEHDDYLAFAKSLDPDLEGAAGFWDPKRNVSVFFKYGTEENFKKLMDASEQLSKEAAEAIRRRERPGELKRLADTLEIAVKVAEENINVEVVSHEATHQMAGNTRLFPPEVRVPSWVHEGLATFFESPSDARWSGIGAVNEERLEWYRALANHRDPKQQLYSQIDFVIGDEIFDLASSHGSTLHAYGQAWALTHFLMKNNFKELMKYYELIGQLPPDMALSPRILRRCFDQAFGQDRVALHLKWQAHMASLKTDLDLLANNN